MLCYLTFKIWIYWIFLKQKTDVSLIALFCCIIHIENICAQIFEANIRKVSWIQLLKLFCTHANAMTHCQFMNLLTEIEENALLFPASAY